MEPRYNEGPRDWQNLFAVTRLRHIEVIFHIIEVTKIIRYTEDFVVERFVISRFHCKSFLLLILIPFTLDYV